MKKSYVIFSALLLALSSTACASKKSTKNVEQNIIETDNRETDNSENIEEDSTIKSLLENTPSHINKVFDDNYAVDADVHVPIISKADILSAKYMRLEEQALLATFYTEKAPEKQKRDVDSIIFYKDEDSNLTMSDGYTIYRTNDFETIRFPIENLTSENEIFSTGRKFGEVYKQDELSFMTKEEAVRTARDILKQLSIETAEEVEVYAIDFATLQQQQDERIQNEIAMQERMGVSAIQDPADGYQTKETFTQEDEFYVIYFTILQDQIPVTQKAYNILDGERTLIGSTARLFLSAKGVIAFEENGLCRTTGIAESPDKIISAEQAIENAYEIHNSILSTDKVTVHKIDFEYVPVAYNGNYYEVKLTPAWSLTLTYHSGISEKDRKEEIISRMVYINAVTGEEIK